MRKIAFITGSRKGIGRSIAEHLLSLDWTVIGCSRKKSDLTHCHYHHELLDVSDEKAVVQTLKKIKKEHGPVQALINNNGVASMNHLLLTPSESYEKIFQTNVLGSFLVLRETAKQMSRNGGGRNHKLFKHYDLKLRRRSTLCR